MSDLLEMYTLGGLALRLNGLPLTGFVSRKEQALLVYLACNPRPHARELLAELLWNERSQAQSLTNLRAVLSRLHKQVPMYLTITHQAVALNRAHGYWLDVAELDRHLQIDGEQRTRVDRLSALTAAQLEQAVALYQGDFLTGFDVRDCQGFQEWALAERTRLQHQVIEALHRLIECHLETGAYSAGIAQAARLLRLDSLREVAHRQMMQLLVYTGQRSAALSQYETCCRLLAEELGVEPTRETTALYEAIRTGTLVLPPAPVTSVSNSSIKPSHNLPVQSTSFVGREAELAQIDEYLDDPSCRLIVLVGPGGIGKTRLALQAAANWIAGFAQGTYFVPLVSVNSVELLACAMADALKVSFYGPEPYDVQIVNHLRGKHMLLVLDNFEHLLEGTALLTEILTAALSVKILVTSRERLNSQEEWVFSLEGLPFPASEAADRIESYSAVQLFVQRARQVQAKFVLAENADSVARICQLVEGMPLGLELAATWLRVMPSRQIASRMDHNLGLLTRPLRNVPSRHSSLRAVFEQSWSLLSAAERQALAALSIFRSGFDLVAAEQVAATGLPMLAALVDKSLIRVNASGRYDLHELVRQFASDKLNQSGQAETVANRHLAFFLSVAEQAETAWYDPQWNAWHAHLETEHDNLRAALTWSLVGGQAEAGLRLAGALGWWFWHMRQHWREGYGWLQKILALSTGALPAPRAKALRWAGELAFFLGDYINAKALCEESLRLAQAVEDPANAAWSLGILGFVADVQNDHGHAAAMLEEALALFRKTEDKNGIKRMLLRLGRALTYLSEYDWATAVLEEVVVLARATGDKGNAAWAQYRLGNVARCQGSADSRATTFFRDSLSTFREGNDKMGIAHALVMLGALARSQGNYAEAQALCEQSLTVSQELGHKFTDVYCLAQLGGLARAQGRPRTAARLLGATETLFEAIGQLYPPDQVNFDRDVVGTRVQLGEEAFSLAWAEGQAMTLDQAIAYALDHSS